MNKRTEKKFKCEACNLFVASQKCLEVHRTGRGHAQKQKEWDLKTALRDLSSEYIVTDGFTNFKCTLCTFVASSLVALTEHTNEKKHKEKLKEYNDRKKSGAQLYLLPLIKIGSLNLPPTIIENSSHRTTIAKTDECKDHNNFKVAYTQEMIVGNSHDVESKKLNPVTEPTRKRRKRKSNC